MKSQNILRTSGLLILGLAAWSLREQSAWAQAAADPIGQPAVAAPISGPAAAKASAVGKASSKDKGADKTDDKGKSEEPAAPAKPKVDPEVIRLDLEDGSGISGKLSIKDITVETRFGSLTIPVTEIKSFTPGLDSKKELGERVKTLIEKLGADDFNERKQAQDDLGKMGAVVRSELLKFTKDENAERARRVQTLLEALEADAGDDDGAAVKMSWIHPDTVETADFTVTGKISPKSFEITSKFGTLSVALADIQRGRREVSTKEEIRKNVTVDQSAIAFAGRAFKTSGIKVEKGDKITITVEGSLTMSPWGNESQSTPEGDQNTYGVCSVGGQSFPGGALIGKLGDSGTPFKVGSKYSAVADRTGILQFAIAMQPNYARGNYQFPGGYNAKIKKETK